MQMQHAQSPQMMGGTWRSSGGGSLGGGIIGVTEEEPLEIPLIPLSPVQKLRRHRSTPIIHGDLQEPAVDYKLLTEDRIRYPHSFQRYHLINGLSVMDMDRIVQSARDQCYKTKKGGAFRSSSGVVSYSHTQKMAVELDANNLCGILVDRPANGACGWRIFDVEHQFRMRQGRHGVWWDYGMPLAAFMTLFPRTFELYGTHYTRHHSYVRLRHKWAPRLLDPGDTVMVNLARLKEPKLLQHQKAKMLNPLNELVGQDMDEAAGHNFSTALKLKIHVPETTLLPHN